MDTQDKEPRVWWRYIDDIFAIWAHGEPSLRVIVENLNHHYTTIQFTASWSVDEVTFLDTRLYLRDCHAIGMGGCRIVERRGDM